MNLSEFQAAVLAKAGAVKDAVEGWLNAHPDIESEAAGLAKGAVGELSALATATVDKEPLPPALVSAADTAIAAINAKAQADIEAIQAKAQADVAELEAAKCAA